MMFRVETGDARGVARLRIAASDTPPVESPQPATGGGGRVIIVPPMLWLRHPGGFGADDVVNLVRQTSLDTEEIELAVPPSVVDRLHRRIHELAEDDERINVISDE